MIIIYIFIFLIGLALGSFLNVCIHRLPQGESVIFPRSHCPACGHKIKNLDNIPLISYLLLRGECRYCGWKIAWHYPLVEFITPLILLGIFILHGSSFNLLFFKYSVFYLISTAIFFTDLFRQMIPDRLSLALMVSGVIFSLLPGNDISWLESILSGLSIFSFFLILAYVFHKFTGKESLGGGDIKYLTAVAANLGWLGSLFTIMLGSILALLILLISGHDHNKKFPFGPFLITGSLIFFLLKEFVLHNYLTFYK
ncbi:MAG: prepilin peptidase [Candidatus Cloacimonetes bacterium]|nr:prepilin peptidase [Candidatus Cloacimonadota bacterium]